MWMLWSSVPTPTTRLVCGPGPATMAGRRLMRQLASAGAMRLLGPTWCLWPSRTGGARQRRRCRFSACWAPSAGRPRVAASSGGARPGYGKSAARRCNLAMPSSCSAPTGGSCFRVWLLRLRVIRLGGSPLPWPPPVLGLFCPRVAPSSSSFSSPAPGFPFQVLVGRVRGGLCPPCFRGWLPRVCLMPRRFRSDCTRQADGIGLWAPSLFNLLWLRRGFVGTKPFQSSLASMRLSSSVSRAFGRSCTSLGRPQ